ncbi:MAG: hypothetical protein IPL20_03240 [Saprospiraceae bacterium]|nr:hypothetical protein [Saprospiraceae bacterium]
MATNTKIIIITNPTHQSFMVELARKCLDKIYGRIGERAIKNDEIRTSYAILNLIEFNENRGYFLTAADEKEHAGNKILTWKNLQESGRQIMAESEIVIVNHKYLHQIVDYTDIIKSNTQHNLANKVYFFIHPDLLWSNELEEGYKYALDIINALSVSKMVPQFRFISMLPYGLLMKKSTPQYLKMVESFPFYDLLEEPDILVDHLTDDYSKIHYEFIRRIVVSDVGYISYLLHEIKDMINKPTPSLERTKQIIDIVNNQAYMIDLESSTISSKILEPLQLNENSNTKEILIKAREILEYVVTMSQVGIKLGASQYKALIIEDDPENRSEIKYSRALFFSNRRHR